MARNHRCQGSDHISKLTADAGFQDWQTIWNANPTLQQRRANPNILFKGDRYSAGDTVRIPDSESRIETGGTGSHHPFVVEDNRLFLRIRILKDDFTAVTNASYTLTVDGAPAPFEGQTDANGQLEHEIPRTAQSGQLVVRVPGDQTDAASPPPAADASAPPSPPPPPGSPPLRGPVPVSWNLQIGALNPIMENAPDRWCISGVQQRLNNLALNTGPIDGIKGPNTEAAIREFQRIFGLDVDGKPGQLQTQPKLQEVHDRPDSVLGPMPPPPPASG
jgi:hypothetical protein